MSKQPYILPENVQRNSGKFAQYFNINACVQVADAIRTTLGPKGMDKMVVDSMGESVVTNDGVTILKELEIEQPAAKMVVEVAKTQEKEVGDGTTTAVIISGELLKNAQSLLEKNIHPTIITRGYRLAFEKALTFLDDLSIKVDENDRELLLKVVETAITGKGSDYAKKILAELVVDAVLSVKDSNGIYDKESIKIEKRSGSGVENSELIKGIVLDKEVTHSNMPKKVRNAKILLLNKELEIRKTETDAKIEITSPDQLQSFLDMEEKMIKDMVEKIVNSGANVVVSQKGIDEIAQYYLAKKGIMALRRVPLSDMKKIARATSGNIVSNLDNFSEKDFGMAGIVEEKLVGEDNMIFINDCINPKSVTILVRGGTEHVVDETKRAIEDAIGDVLSVLRTKKLVSGAGSTEIELSMKIREFANTLKGREQLAANSFADSLEIVPRTLAENSGLDPIDVITELKASHKKGNKFDGIDIFTGNLIDSKKKGIIEPYSIKKQALSSATEVTNMILRIDDVILASTKNNGQNSMMNQYQDGNF